MPTCPRCGATVPEGAVYCGNCGATINAASISSTTSSSSQSSGTPSSWSTATGDVDMNARLEKALKQNERLTRYVLIAGGAVFALLLVLIILSLLG